MDIYTQLLEIIEAAYEAQDYACFRAVVSVPHVLLTPGSIRKIRTDAEMEGLFVGFSELMRSHRIRRPTRIGQFAQFRAVHRIRGGHETHLIDESGLRVKTPYRVTSNLARHPEHGWQVQSSHNAFEDRAWASLAFAGANQG